MSQENIEVVRAYYAAWNEAGVEGVLSFWTPDFEWHDAPEMPDSSVYRGADAVLAHFSDLDDAIGRMHVEVVDLDPVGRGDVVAGLRVHLDGNASGLPFQGPIFEAITLRQGKVSRIRLFLSPSEAREAVGLSEQAMLQEDAEQWDLAEAGFGALNSGDLDAFLALTAEDVEFTSMVAEAEGTTFRGHDGVRAWWETVRGAFEDVRWKLLGLRGSGDRGVMHFRMTGTLGSVPVEQTMWQAVMLRDGKLIWWAFFRSEREALEAVGLSE